MKHQGIDDIAHMADQERKREREEGIGPKAMVSITFDKWREVIAELEQLRGSEIQCREALESAENTARKQRATFGSKPSAEDRAFNDQQKRGANMKFDLTPKQTAELIQEITLKYIDIDACLTTRNRAIVEEMLSDLIESAPNETD
jgi:hypothetical protein